MKNRAVSLALGLGTLALAFCTLVEPMEAGLNNPVSRPLKVTGTLTLVVDPVSGVFEFTDVGLATHTGRTTNSGSGIINLLTGIFLSGSGVAVAADGDTLSWVVSSTPTPNSIV